MEGPIRERISKMCSKNRPNCIPSDRDGVHRRGGQVAAQPCRRCGGGEPSPGADVAGASPVPAQMWRGRAQSRRRCGRGEPTRGQPTRRCIVAHAAGWRPHEDLYALCDFTVLGDGQVRE
jgi:hypothetical protein